MSLELLSLDNIHEIAREYGYWAIFIGIALENTGIPLPGETITIVGGFLSGSGELNYWLVLACAIAGAVLGNNFGYWIGEIAGWSFLLRIGRLFGIQEDRMEEAKTKFTDNAARAVFFGRFIPLLRIFAGPMAGISKMPYPKFLLCNIGGAALWSSTMITLAFFLGRLVPLDELVHRVAQFGIVVLGAIVLWLVIPTWLESRKSPLKTED